MREEFVIFWLSEISGVAQCCSSDTAVGPLTISDDIQRRDALDWNCDAHT
jgi:hypothetical protein